MNAIQMAGVRLSRNSFTTRLGTGFARRRSMGAAQDLRAGLALDALDFMRRMVERTPRKRKEHRLNQVRRKASGSNVTFVPQPPTRRRGGAPLGPA